MIFQFALFPRRSETVAPRLTSAAVSISTVRATKKLWHSCVPPIPTATLPSLRSVLLFRLVCSLGVGEGSKAPRNKENKS